MPPAALFLVGAVAQYSGASIAVLLFEDLRPTTVAWLRVAGAAMTMLTVVRPWRWAWTRAALGAAAAFGVTTALMNTAFYLAIDRLPLGTAVAIEFAGPVTVAALASHTRRHWSALVLATSGVLLLAGIEIGGSGLGVLFALGAAALWAGYIVLGARVARQGRGAAGLAVGLVVGTAVITPLGAPGSAPVLDSPALLGLGASVGVLSTAIPYGLDQAVLRRVTRRHFALLLALLPVTATVMGLIVLGQVPGPAELAGTVLVIGALLVQGSGLDGPGAS